MATIVLQDIQFRRNTASYYTTTNPLLQIGEPAFEIDTYRLKIGNGTDRWNDLAYVAGGVGGAGSVDSVNGQTGIVVLDADDIDQSSTINKFVTSSHLAKLSHITVTQAVNLDTIESLATSALQSYNETDPVFSVSQASNITSAHITALNNLSGVNTGDQDISGIATNASAIQTLTTNLNTANSNISTNASDILALEAQQITQNNAIALNTAKVSYPGPQNASQVPVSPSINSNSDVQSVLEDHETRIDNLASGGSDGVITNVVLSGTDLNFTGSGGGFNGTVSLSSLTSTPTNEYRGYVDSTGNGLIGVQNNSNVLFTTSQNAYLANSLIVFVSGNPLSKGNGLTETNPAAGTFTLDVAPQSYERIIIQYSN